MPFAPNPLFVGREKDLRALAQHLEAGSTSVIGEVKLAAASGLGGIGKTQLAVELVHRYGQFFQGGVFWLSFADRAGVPAEVAACGAALELHPDWAALPVPEQTRRVQSAWSAPEPRLLVFDNCEDESLLAEWRPKTGGARVLVTSRRESWSRALGVEAVALDTLPTPVGVELLRKFRPDLSETDPDLAAIVEELGGLALALHLAGSYLERYQDSRLGQPSRYVAELRTKGLLDHSSLQSGVGHSPTDHEMHVGKTFALSLRRLDPGREVDALARALLARAAFFAPGEPIPREILGLTRGQGENEELLEERERALGRLTALGLLGSGARGALVIHRLVAAFARKLEEGEEAESAVESALLEEANRRNNFGIPGPILEWQPHLRAVTERARRKETQRGAALCNTLGFHLWTISDYSGVRPYFERALAIRDKVLGPEHPDTARSLNNLGGLLQDEGDLSGARPYYERALAIWEKVLGPEHPDTARSLNNLGSLLQAEGDLPGARRYYERALAIWEKVLGPEHPDTAQSLNNLGFLLKAEGDFSRARPYYERALAIREKVLGPEHPDTAQSLNNLGFLPKAEGDLSGARAYFERALAIWEKVLGPEHPATALSLNNLAGLLKAEGDFAGARSYYERALAIRERVLGPEHPDTALCLNDLGSLIQAEGDLPGARSYFERALATYEARLGPEHPTTKIVRKNLAILDGLST